MKRLLLLFVVLNVFLNTHAQEKITLTLTDVLRIAQNESLESFVVKNSFLTNFWQYKSFKADYLPELGLNSDLISYSNSNNLRYNSISKTEDYVRTETLNSNVALSLRQNIGLTGGAFYVEFDLVGNHNFGERAYTQFSSRPFSLGYVQKLFAYNQLKWQRKLEPQKYEKAKRDYLHDMEEVNIQTCTYFFNLIKAQITVEIASNNKATTDTLLLIAERRFLLGTIRKDELLELELNKNNTDIKLEEANMQYRKNREILLNFLRLDPNVEIDLLLPEVLELNISVDKAVQLAKNGNAEILKQKINLLTAESDVQKAKAERRFQTDLNMWCGISKVDGYYDNLNNVAVNGKVANLYQGGFDDYQQLGLSLKVPILDWGKRKGEYRMALSRQEVARIRAEQALVAFEQDVATQVLEFNLKYNKVLSAEKSDDLAKMSYDLATVRFRRGGLDVLKLTNSQNAKDNARLQYINSLYEYWSDYYRIRKLTLYDFMKKENLGQNFEDLFN